MGQSLPARASLKVLPGTSADPAIPDAIAGTTQWGSHVPGGDLAEFSGRHAAAETH
jgi:hypothetical protein